MASRTQSFTSVTTWSLRLRPVWSLRPSVAEPVDQGLLDVGVDVFEGDVEIGIRPASISAPMSSRAAAIASASSGVTDADLGEHAGVGLAGRDVVPVQPAVEAIDSVNASTRPSVGAANRPAPGLLAHRAAVSLVNLAPRPPLRSGRGARG